jgi:hypothetical protein
MLALAAVCATTACDDKKAEAEEIPESIRGSYGRDDTDAFFDTLGLEVDKDVLRYSEMRVKIISGKMVGSTYQVDEAEVTWARQDEPPKKCKGTLARQGERLLISMFKQDADETCESSLKGEWKAWAPTTKFPEPMLGTFGTSSLYGGFTTISVTPEAITFTDGEAITIDQGVAFEGRDDYVLVRKGKWPNVECKGSVSMVEGNIRINLDPIDEDAPRPCPRFTFEPWTINAANLPKKSVDNGKVRLDVDGKTLKLSTLDEQGLRCEQKILRSGTRSSTDSGRDRIPVGAGEVLVLERKAPTAGTDGCDERLRNLASNRCEELFGAPCEGQLLEDFHGSGAVGLRCPTHVIIGDATTHGRKIALLPQSIPNVVCFEMSGDFQGG